MYGFQTMTAAALLLIKIIELQFIKTGIYPLMCLELRKSAHTIDTVSSNKITYLL
jgi:hypothetical protein